VSWGVVVWSGVCGNVVWRGVGCGVEGLKVGVFCESSGRW